ncbi:Hypothetical predicted protein [Mytilus galloprovincialis]|uniref:Uncharacterized protein n=1 Tax=Mytilus galloprovincialis TaxID=29158 RepID=A0A8B6D0S4_MYTGA|nr:Hypothetical predicted protein [Mytilus galloprovincialis]
MFWKLFIQLKERYIQSMVPTYDPILLMINTMQSHRTKPIIYKRKDQESMHMVHRQCMGIESQCNGYDKKVAESGTCCKGDDPPTRESLRTGIIVDDGRMLEH